MSHAELPSREEVAEKFMIAALLPRPAPPRLMRDFKQVGDAQVSNAPVIPTTNYNNNAAQHHKKMAGTRGHEVWRFGLRVQQAQGRQVGSWLPSTVCFCCSVTTLVLIFHLLVIVVFSNGTNNRGGTQVNDGAPIVDLTEAGGAAGGDTRSVRREGGSVHPPISTLIDQLMSAGDFIWVFGVEFSWGRACVP